MEALIAEDHESLAKALRWALQRILPSGWDVQTTGDGRTAEYILIMDPGLHLAVLDYLLPHADADRIVTEALKVRPHLRGKIIISSGVPDFPDDVERRLFSELGCRRLDKPVDFDDLERLVLEIIGGQ
jgi:DNA-binding response OmpR family regulator